MTKSPAPLGSVELLFRALERLEQASAHGAVWLDVERVDGEASWRVFAQGGRICWASGEPAVSILSRRLVEAAAIDWTAMESIFQDCQESGRPLGETLVSRGLISSEALRATLLEHISMTLADLAGQAREHPIRLVQTSLDGPATIYARHLTFTGTEVFLEAVERAVEMTVEIGTLPRHVVEWAPQTPFAACLRLTGHDDPPAVPVFCTVAERLELSELMRCYRRAVRLARPPALAIAGIEPFAALVTDDGDGWLLSYDHLFVSVYSLSSQIQSANILRTIVDSRSLSAA